MPRIKRRGHALRCYPDCDPHWQELILGPTGESVFASDAERRALWMEHAWELTAEWTEGAHLWAEGQYGMPRKGNK